MVRTLEGVNATCAELKGMDQYEIDELKMIRGKMEFLVVLLDPTDDAGLMDGLLHGIEAEDTAKDLVRRLRAFVAHITTRLAGRE